MTNTALMAITILGGLLSATFFLFQVMLITFFAPLPLFLIGLGVGLRPLYGAGLLATTIILLFGGPFFGAEFFAVFVLGPALLVNRALLNRKNSSGKVIWYPSSLLLRDLTYAAVLVMCLALADYIYLTHTVDLHTLVKPFLKSLDPQGHFQDAEAILIKIFPVLPSLFAFFWAGMMLINAALAQGLLVRFKRNLRPSPSFEGLEVPKVFLIGLGFSFILSLVGVGYVEILGKNTAFVLIFPFFVSGLGLIHRGFHKTSFATLGLTVFYFVLLLFLWPAFFVILVGILKPWIEKFIPPN